MVSKALFSAKLRTCIIVWYMSFWRIRLLSESTCSYFPVIWVEIASFRLYLVNIVYLDFFRIHLKSKVLILLPLQKQVPCVLTWTRLALKSTIQLFKSCVYMYTVHKTWQTGEWAFGIIVLPWALKVAKSTRHGFSTQSPDMPSHYKTWKTGPPLFYTTHAYTSLIQGNSTFLMECFFGLPCCPPTT